VIARPKLVSPVVTYWRNWTDRNGVSQANAFSTLARMRGSLRCSSVMPAKIHLSVLGIRSPLSLKSNAAILTGDADVGCPTQLVKGTGLAEATARSTIAVAQAARRSYR
jgi:hypothetical protein